VIEGNLGIAFHCISALAKYAWEQFRIVKENKEISIRSAQVTRAILLINADHYSAWNCRKMCILQGIIDPLKELQLSGLVLSKHPKSGETWAHRRWVLEKLELFDRQGEIAICEKTAEIYAKNYYAWTHRRWIFGGNHITLEDFLQEIERVQLWIRYHISQHCALFYLQFLCSKVSSLLRSQENDTAISDFFKGRFEFVNRLIDTYPGHESLWMHKRFLWTLQYDRELSNVELSAVLQKELGFCTKYFKDADEDDLQNQLFFAIAYQFWICRRLLVQCGSLQAFPEIQERINFLKNSALSLSRGRSISWLSIF
jgi:protein prenyltransferase alpha subunit repeat containing protein 1